MAGGIFEQYNWPEGRSDYVEVCDGCHTAIWSTRWNEETSDGFDAFLAENGWRDYMRALRRGETRGLADTWLRPTHVYTHAFREVDAQLFARERMVAGLLLTEGRAS